MTVIIKYPRQNEDSNKEFFERKEKELTNLDWAKWGGWFDTDGSFNVKGRQTTVALKLKDREPVELFCKTFETSLRYQEHRTITPNGAKYLAKEHLCYLTGKKAIWFTENVSKYIFNKTTSVRNLLSKHNLPYRSYDHNLSKDELINYISSALQGDGCFYDVSIKKTGCISFCSANSSYLTFIKKELLKHDINFSGPHAGLVYQTKAGTRTQFQIIFNFRKRQQAINFFEELIPKIEMTRKRERAISSLNYFKQ